MQAVIRRSSLCYLACRSMPKGAPTLPRYSSIGSVTRLLNPSSGMRHSGQGGCCCLSHCSMARCPPSAAYWHASSSQGQGGCCCLSHCSTARSMPKGAPTLPRYSSIGSVTRLPNPSAPQRAGRLLLPEPLQHGQGPPSAAYWHASSSQGQGGCCCLSHCSTARCPAPAA